MRLLAFIFGIVLLLPGACSLVFMSLSTGGSSLGALPLLWLVCFGVSFGGFLMIRYAVKKPPSPEPPKQEDPPSPAS